MKLNLGDKVRVVDEFWRNRLYIYDDCIVLGCEKTEWDEWVIIKSNGEKHWVPEYTLEKVDKYEHSEKISIVASGDSTIATFYKDGKESGSACAKCHPNDKFDIRIGALVALLRLIGRDDIDGYKLLNSELKQNEATDMSTKKTTETFAVGDTVYIAPFEIAKEIAKQNECYEDGVYGAYIYGIHPLAYREIAQRSRTVISSDLHSVRVNSCKHYVIPNELVSHKPWVTERDDMEAIKKRVEQLGRATEVARESMLEFGDILQEYCEKLRKKCNPEGNA